MEEDWICSPIGGGRVENFDVAVAATAGTVAVAAAATTDLVATSETVVHMPDCFPELQTSAPRQNVAVSACRGGDNVVQVEHVPLGQE